MALLASLDVQGPVLVYEARGWHGAPESDSGMWDQVEVA